MSDRQPLKVSARKTPADTNNAGSSTAAADAPLLQVLGLSKAYRQRPPGVAGGEPLSPDGLIVSRTLAPRFALQTGDRVIIDTEQEQLH